MNETPIRAEEPADQIAVRAVEEAAFEAPGEADLVDALRGEPGVISLVAELAGEIVGHLLLSPVRVEGPRTSQALALGPMAVLPGHQNRGIGSALVRASLEQARASGAPAVIVLGHPDYYPRFGFEPTEPHGLTCKWPVPPGVYLVCELESGWLKAQGGGLVQYHAAFDGVT